MGRRSRPPNAPAGRPGRLPADVSAERNRLVQELCARARIVHGMTVCADVIVYIQAQDVWADRFREYGAPSDNLIRAAWNALNPSNVDLCANASAEKVHRTAAEERQAAIVRARETVNRWYGVERELVLERDAAFDPEQRRKLEERISKAQAARMEAEAQLSACLSLIDDESFDSPQLRSEVIAILARNRALFTPDECDRLRALFTPGEQLEPEDLDPDLPEYMQ